MESIIFTVVILALLGGLIYLVFVHPKGGRDAYFYIVAFITLAILFWAVTDLVRVVWEMKWGVSGYSSGYTYPYRGDQGLRRISMRLSTFLVTFPIWAFHWFKASLKPAEKIDWLSRKTYALVVLVLTAFLVLGCGTGLVYRGMNALLGVEAANDNVMAFLVPYSLAGLGVWTMHYMAWREANGKIEAGITGKE